MHMCRQQMFISCSEYWGNIYKTIINVSVGYVVELWIIKFRARQDITKNLGRGPQVTNEAPKS